MYAMPMCKRRRSARQLSEWPHGDRLDGCLAGCSVGDRCEGWGAVDNAARRPKTTDAMAVLLWLKFQIRLHDGWSRTRGWYVLLMVSATIFIVLFYAIVRLIAFFANSILQV